MPSEQQLSDVLREFAGTMVTDFPIQAILDHLVDRIVAILPITAAGVTLISPGVKPRYIAASNKDALQFEKLQTELREGPCLAAFESGQAVQVPDLRTDDRFPIFSSRAVEAGLAAVFTFPMRYNDVRIGALDLYRDTPGPLSAETLYAAEALADVASAYVRNAQSRADLLESSDRSRKAAMHDGLTGLPNRILLLERLEHAFLRARRSNHVSALLFLDLDGFKMVNDTYGHGVGDAVLVAVAARLTEVLQPGDTLARLAGDEFAILCEDLGGPAHADGIVERIHAALLVPFVVADIELVMQASIGIAFTGHDRDDPETLLHHPDTALYAAKRTGGGRHQTLDLRDRLLAERNFGLSRDLRGAIGRGELHLQYQPIVATSGSQITGAEALLRWARPSRGMVAPTVLVPLAEQSGLIIEIGRWVLAQAWADRQHWCRPWHADELSVSVNVSAHQFMSIGFVETVANVLDAVPSDPALLTLELTEGVFFGDGERALVVLDELKALGVKLALDDFGTGYSSLSYLKRFPVDVVKIDRVFVSDLVRDPASHIIVTAVIALAQGLGMTVVAEGVETAEQHHELTQLGCDSCQGYYFARPMPDPQLDAFLRQQVWRESSGRDALTATAVWKGGRRG